MDFKGTLLKIAEKELVEYGLAMHPVYMGGLKGEGEDLFGNIFDSLNVSLEKFRESGLLDDDDLPEEKVDYACIILQGFEMFATPFHIAFKYGLTYTEEIGMLMRAELSGGIEVDLIDRDLSFLGIDMDVSVVCRAFLQTMYEEAEKLDESFADDPELIQYYAEVCFISGVASGSFYRTLKLRGVSGGYNRGQNKPKPVYRSLKKKKKKR